MDATQSRGSRSFLFPDRLVSSIVHKYRRRRSKRERADSGHHTNMTTEERQTAAGGLAITVADNTYGTYGASSSRGRNINNNRYVKQHTPQQHPYNDRHHQQQQQQQRHSIQSTSSSSQDDDDDDVVQDNTRASFRSACSGMTPRNAPSMTAESGMSVRLQHYHIGTPVSYRLHRNSSSNNDANENDDHSLNSARSGDSATNHLQHDTFISQQQQQRQEEQEQQRQRRYQRMYQKHRRELQQEEEQEQQDGERRASFFSRRPRVRQGSSNPSIGHSWRIRRARGAMMEDQSLPDFEMQVFCPTCEKWVQSRIRYRLGALTWLVAFILFMCTVFLFWVPFYVKYFKGINFILLATTTTWCGEGSQPFLSRCGPLLSSLWYEYRETFKAMIETK
ncbi:hypothetical protein BDB00DRAFT_815292 [Zychaea mexicana]|uniref:uncharacterized protein n=1 Tax=Zychaea mexicana TaxID=64656 RepID=UPI0022FE0716|nr:uncharacterized protein BDB00DRAFT_815292 [Zychaea mexicana]KAI9495253.1 hypothetical protein BDB00DRAFT_815292 [Zychaea mexicana]